MAEVLRINPKNVDALTVTAGVLDTLRRKDEARSFYERAIAIEPENKYLRMSYANNLASSGRLDRAIETYEELTLDYPEDQVLFQYLGIAYGFSGDYAKSIESLKQAVYLKPTPTAYYNLATAYRKTGDFGEAVRYLKLYLDDPRGEPEKSIRAARAELQRLEANPSK
jgi:tetratricopeptide (TPR) repeat protein